MRISLAFLNFLALHCLRRSVIQKFGSSAGKCFLWICCSQFHLMFYLGRPLPNIFALAIITYAFSCYLDGVYFSLFFSHRTTNGLSTFLPCAVSLFDVIHLFSSPPSSFISLSINTSPSSKSFFVVSLQVFCLLFSVYLPSFLHSLLVLCG